MSVDEQWLRIKLILSCSEVYEALGISSLSHEMPANFYYARGLEVIGTLANLLMRGGIHCQFVDSRDEALGESRKYLDTAFRGDYGGAEAYSCRDAWCDWFFGDEVLHETVLLGKGHDWWLLMVTGTD